jgi:hypothetical protein
MVIMKTFYIELFNNGITTTKEKKAENLEELLKDVNSRQMGKMEYQIFSGKPYTFDNLVYIHHSESFYK